jgi:hypothetical protein
LVKGKKMNSLIDPTTNVRYVSNWTLASDKKSYNPVFSIYENSARVCEVVEIVFEIAEPLFFVNCDSNVVADMYWYNTVTTEILEIVNAEYPVIPPAEVQPTNNIETL